MEADRRSPAPNASRAVVRTCVGCRKRVEQPDLLRVVAGRLASSPEGDWWVTPDERRSAPGRGAWVHPDPECVQRAIARQAFGRALRQGGRADTSLLRSWLTQQD